MGGGVNALAGALRVALFDLPASGAAGSATVALSEGMGSGSRGVTTTEAVGAVTTAENVSGVEVDVGDEVRSRTPANAPTMTPPINTDATR